MSNQDTEEKKLPASQMKLKKQREKGKIAKSPDLYSAVAGVVGLSLLLLLIPYEYRQFSHMFDASLQAMQFEWNDGLKFALSVNFFGVLMIMSPIFAAVLFAVIVSNLIYNKGVPISLDPLIPKFERLNPVEGLKKIFGRRGVIEGAQKLIRLTLWLTVAFVIFWLLHTRLLNSPICGEPCVRMVGQSLALQLTVAAIIIMLLIAFFDMPIQKALFLHEMKMGHSEKKKEDKDQYGSPEVRSEIRRLRKELLESSGKVGVKHATLIIQGDSNIVAIRYQSGENVGPIVVAKEKVSSQGTLSNVANSLNLPHVFDSELSNNLSTIPAGSAVPQRFYERLAIAMVKTRSQ